MTIDRDWAFSIKNQRGIYALPHWLDAREWDSFIETKDRNGVPMIGLRQSDYRRHGVYKKVGVILVYEEAFYGRALRIVSELVPGFCEEAV
jgi:hypothetical protein